MNGMYINGGANRFNLLKNFSFESYSLLLMPLVFEKVYHASHLAFAKGFLDMFKDDSGKHDETLYQHFLDLVRKTPPNADVPDPEGEYQKFKHAIDEILQYEKLFRKIKHLNKAQVVARAKGKSFKKSVIDYLEKHYQSIFFHFNTEKLYWMWKEGIIKSFPIQVENGHNTSMAFSNYFSIVFENEDDFLYLDDLVEVTLHPHFAPQCFEPDYQAPNADHWFISVPLYHLRFYLTLIDEKEMRQMRQLFIEKAKQFYEPLINLCNALNEIAFAPENLQQIGNLVKQHLTPNMETVDHEISNAPFSQIFDKFSANKKTSIVLNVGISSPENILQHYMKLNIIKPFETNTILKNIENSIAADHTHIFFYATVINDTDKGIQRGAGLELNDKTRQLLTDTKTEVTA
jgi:hypothetical protein